MHGEARADQPKPKPAVIADTAEEWAALRLHMPPAHLIMADPPWQFGDALGKRGAAANYQVMDLEGIKRFPLPLLAAEGCFLMLWRVASLQEEALAVVKAWGFTVKSEIVWRKLTVTGKRWFGMGRYVRAEHETCLLAVAGRVRVADRSVRSTFEAVAREHSRKPEEIYEIADRLVPANENGARVELFARQPRAGWFSVGNELVARENVTSEGELSEGAGQQQIDRGR
jgi:N6-adenosine-specific RNA methylase IME4